MAREVVARVLGVVVERLDDGSAPRMPDGLIRYTDGRLASLEVIGDHDVEFEEQDAALDGRRVIHIDGLRWSWSLTLERETRVRSLLEELPARLRSAEISHAEPVRAAQSLLSPEDHHDLALFAASARTDGPPGRVTLRAAPFTGFGSGAGALPDWVERVLSRQSDVGPKLAGAGRDGHVFIWATIGSEAEAQTALDGAATDLPTRAPRLPDGITHVWVMSGFSSTRGLAWFPDRGWHELAFRWHHEQPLRLTQPP